MWDIQPKSVSSVLLQLQLQTDKVREKLGMNDLNLKSKPKARVCFSEVIVVAANKKNVAVANYLPIKPRLLSSIHIQERSKEKRKQMTREHWVLIRTWL